MRKKLFTLLTILLPFLAILLLEILFRLIGIGKPESLANREIRFGKEYFVINRQVARRYFTLDDPMIPEAADEFFEIHKSPQTVRIFCLGGSTTAGFPYEINATFPFQLKHRLQKAFPDRKFEVINLGISAINSYSILDLLPEILQFEPDLLILYTGHNEFYGAFGVASSQFISSHRTLVKAYLKLSHLHLFQLIRQMIHTLSRKLSQKPSDASGTLMKAMAGDQLVTLDSKEYWQARHNFEANLREILEIARRHHTPVFVGTLVSNLKDQPPFVSEFSPETDEATKRRWERLFLEALEFQNAGQHEQALTFFQQLAEIDSLPAKLYFFRAHSLLSMGDTLRARQEFARALDHDPLRFRAPSFFNPLIKKVAQQMGAYLVEIESVFSRASPEGIPGRELFHEHVHPNFSGYQLMAETFFSALVHSKVLTTTRDPSHSFFEYPQNADLIGQIIKHFQMDSAGVTELDVEFGYLRSFLLTHRWPFPERPVTLGEYQPVGDTVSRDIAYQHIRKQLFWDAAHFRYAEYWENQGRWVRARREYLAVYTAFPQMYFPLMKIGDTYIQENNLKEAEHWYQQGLLLEPENPNLHAKLANVYLFQKEYAAAIQELKTALKWDRTSTSLSDQQRAIIYYLLALSHANLRQWKESAKALKRCLELQPNYPPALKLKQQLLQLFPAPLGN